MAEITKKQIVDLEKFADKLLNKYDIDIEFTRHFVDRVNDDRNSPDITLSELQKFFKKIAKKQGKEIKDEKWIEAVLKDFSTDINLPVAIDYIAGEFVVTAKTIMRKKDFKTSNKVISVENYLNQKKNKDKENPCWDGYEMIGMKKKGKKKVPNCVKVKNENYKEMFKSFSEYISKSN